MNPFTEVNPHDPQLRAERKRAKQLCQQLNALPADQIKARKPIYQQLFGQVSSAYIEPNFYCDYGSNIFLGEKFYANHNCVILDCAEVRIGDRVMFGPSVQIYATTHPLDPLERATGKEFCAAVTIGDDCWIGGGAIILAGVTIGKGSVVGAGSVVTKDIPEGVVAVGNPCSVIRSTSNN
ncbi:sugar O-acetyltransferase [Cellvibrio sp. pealriver]|uniref:sugar O-acetyltransferase n=1 Tax=Cellvibrio sp. pealriver TaxID=1622269 RepID=UPI00066FF505|nr:sugar O-acetyltransferase [Cellvibrio sp. pealriver]